MSRTDEEESRLLFALGRTEEEAGDAGDELRLSEVMSTAKSVKQRGERAAAG